MNKSYPRMKCVVCNRPMARAAALMGGYPVGRVCAAAAGLTPKKRVSGIAPLAHQGGEQAVNVDQLDLFTT